jgi:hypothetical protein
MNRGDLIMMFGVAISTSILISLVDHFIIRHRRAKAAAAHPPQEEPVIIRRPMDPDPPPDAGLPAEP